jgi:hypothetical protein
MVKACILAACSRCISKAFLLIGVAEDGHDYKKTRFVPCQMPEFKHTFYLFKRL